MIELAAALLIQAQQVFCGPTGPLERTIENEHGESLVSAGIVPGGKLFLLANPLSGTFTIILRRPGGVSCILMSGAGFTTVEPTKPGTGT